MSSSSAKKVVVVGGGIAGLSCAWQLRKAGFAVQVLDAGDTPGGRCRDIAMDGIAVRAGARMLYSFYGGVMALIEELGIAQEIVKLGHASIQCESGDRRFPITFGPSKDLLLGGAMSFKTLLRLRKLLPDLLHARRHGDPDDLASLPQYDHQTLAEYLASKGLGEFDANVVQPLFRGARNWNTSDVSPGFFLLTTAFMAGHYGFTFKRGIGYLAQQLAQHLDVVSGVQVRSIEQMQDGARVIATNAEAQQISIDADIVVCATQGSEVLSLLKQPEPYVSTFFAAVSYNPLDINYAVLDLAPAKSLGFYGVGHPSGLAILEAVPGSGTPGDPPKVFCEASPEYSHARFQGASVERRQAELGRHVEAAVPGATIERWVNQWIPSMLPVPYPGYVAKLASFRTQHGAKQQRIYFAGDYLATALVGGACASGLKTAGVITKQWA
jgi:oxygen-dependent protoporphyrinogen oxidase